MTERITFSITLLRDDALHLQEAANEGGLLLSEYAARCLAAIAEDDRRAHDPNAALVELMGRRSPWDPGDTGIPGHPPLRLVNDECPCGLCHEDRERSAAFRRMMNREGT
jgi:hypothetical protein